MDADEIFKRADFSVVLLFRAVIASFTRCSLFLASSVLVGCRGTTCPGESVWCRFALTWQMVALLQVPFAVTVASYSSGSSAIPPDNVFFNYWYIILYSMPHADMICTFVSIESTKALKNDHISTHSYRDFNIIANVMCSVTLPVQHRV